MNRRRGQDGFSTVEVVLATPVITISLLFTLVLGLTVIHSGDLGGAVDAAARAGSLQRSYAAAITAAVEVLDEDLDGVCDGGPQPTWPAATSFTPGGDFVVRVACASSLLGFPGLAPHTTLHGTGVAPIDPYRGVT